MGNDRVPSVDGPRPLANPASWLHCAKPWRSSGGAELTPVRIDLWGRIQGPPRFPARGPRRRPIVENFRDQDLTGHLEFVAEGLPGGDPEQSTGDLRSFLWRPVWQTAIEHVLRNGQFDGFLPRGRGFGGGRSLLRLHNKQAVDLPTLSMLPGSIKVPKHLMSHAHPVCRSRRCRLRAFPLNDDDHGIGSQIDVRLTWPFEHIPSARRGAAGLKTLQRRSEGIGVSVHDSAPIGHDLGSPPPCLWIPWLLRMLQEPLQQSWRGRQSRLPWPPLRH